LRRGVWLNNLTLSLCKRRVRDQLETILLALDDGSTVAHLFQKLVAVVVRVKNRMIFY